MLARYGAGMMSVCVGANFIYPDALEDEMFHMETVAALAEQVGVSYVAFCGGAIRGKGVQTGDYALLAKGLKEAERSSPPTASRQATTRISGPWRKSRSRSTDSFR